MTGPARPLTAALLAAALAATPRPSAAADTLPEPPGAGPWDGPRALELVRAVVEARRGSALGDTALRSFRARAEGHVYFLFDPGPAASALGIGAGERLVRADQLALRIAWRAPGRWRQTVVGRRSERLLPTRIRYHDDHLRVLVENFGHTISLGRGSEVRDVPHPASTGALSTYEYRLVDSLQVRLAGQGRDLYRLQVRPRDRARPGVVGEMFVDGDAPAVARLSFTFTSSSYRDPQLEHISVDLQSGLVDGRYWLPVRQATEVQRQATWLDVPAGGTIRTLFRISGYRLNPPDPVRVSRREGRLLSLPDSALARYDDWEQGLFEGPREETRVDRAAAPELERIRDRARRLAEDRALSGLAPSRLHLPDASHALRVRRGEGVLVGAGVRHRGPGWSASAWAGYPFGARRPEARAALGANDGSGPRLRACLRCLADIGPFPAASGVGATVSAATAGEDFRDPYFRTGVAADWRLPLGAGSLRLGARWEEHESAAGVPGPQSGRGGRRVRRIRDGEGARLELELREPLGRALGASWRAAARAEAASDELGDFGYSRALLRLQGRSPSPAEQAVAWRVAAAGGLAGGRVPAQRLFLLGGRGTVPGHRFRPWGGDRLLLGSVTAAADVAAPWLRARVRASAGWTGLAGPGAAAARRVGAAESGAVRPSVGVGVGLFWDLLRLSVDRGLRDGAWALNLSLDPEFWPVL